MVHSNSYSGRQPGALSAAIARHPASWRAGIPADPPSFSGLVGLLVGDWRVADPDGFAAALTGAPELAGHPVLDLVPGVGDDRGWAAAVRTAAPRPGLELRWVSGFDGDGPAPGASGALFVEARAQAPAGPDGPELFVLAHLVCRLGARGGRERPRPGALGSAGHSWVVLVVGDGAGGVSAVVRATMACPGPVRCCARPPGWARLPLAALHQRLLAPALEAAGVGPADGVILRFSRQRDPAPPFML